MNRSVWLIFAALAVIAAAILIQLKPERMAQAASTSEVLPYVRVQHEYVTVPVGSVNTNDRNRLMRTRTPVESPSGMPALVTRRGTVQRASRDQTLFEKARRAFVGDGRHRPEPFPRPRDNN